jgi:hypothetical protein
MNRFRQCKLLAQIEEALILAEVQVWMVGDFWLSLGLVQELAMAQLTELASMAQPVAMEEVALAPAAAARVIAWIWVKE